MTKVPDSSAQENHIFHLPRLLLNLFGIWPLQTGKIPIRFYIASVTLITAVTASIAHGFINIRHLHVALLSFCPAVFELITWIKLIIFCYHSNTLKTLLGTLLEYYKEGKTNCLCVVFLAFISKFGQTTNWIGIKIKFTRTFNFLNYTEYMPGSRAIYEKNIKWSNVVNFWLFFSAFSTGSLFGMTPIVRNLYLYFTGRPIVRVLPFQA